MSNAKEFLKTMAELDCAGKAAGAEVVKAMTPLMISPLSLWVAMTCPNHPTSYTKEEVKEHRQHKMEK